MPKRLILNKEDEQRIIEAFEREVMRADGRVIIEIAFEFNRDGRMIGRAEALVRKVYPQKVP